MSGNSNHLKQALNHTLENKKIILAVCGGVAAYKAAELVRLLSKQGAQVQVVMTQAATEFVSALTFQALSGKPVRGTLFDEAAEAGMGHIELARWADLTVIAPATANTMAKIAHGRADNLLTTLCLAIDSPLLIAPAMNQQMWRNTATQDNFISLQKRQNIYFAGPAEGEQACGDIGPGRMLEAEQIVAHCLELLTAKPQYLAGKTVLITAGPTVEDIDPVRFLSNRSSGKMGYAIAEAARNAGANVILVSGPSILAVPEHIDLHRVRSAQQMHDAVFSVIAKVDLFIATAAVADYRPKQVLPKKIKKQADKLVLEFVKNPDILSDVAALPNKPLCIGFAAETNDVQDYAVEKLQRKKLDMIAANQVGEGRGFEADTNELSLFWRDQANNKAIITKKLPYATKKQLAQQIIDEIVLLFI